jgi:uncharacterized protein
MTHSLTTSVLAALVLAVFAPAITTSTAAAQAEPIRVLVVTATQGFRHSDAINASHEILRNLDRSSGFEFEITEDVASISAENLAGFDVLFLNNATLRAAPADPTSEDQVAATRTQRVEAPVTVEQQRAISEFVRSGKGFASAHSGVDAFYGWDEYREMVGGGLFQSHPWTQEVQINVEDRENPAVSHFGPSFRIHDEIYVLDANPRSSSRVLLSLDMPSTGADDQAQDHPISWIRRHGDGRVFVTVLGHFGDVWKRADFQEHVLQGLRIAAGRVPAQF